jgi:hypothetical protein
MLFWINSQWAHDFLLVFRLEFIKLVGIFMVIYGEYVGINNWFIVDQYKLGD